MSLDGRHDRRTIKPHLLKDKSFKLALLARQFQTRVGRVRIHVLPASLFSHATLGTNKEKRVDATKAEEIEAKAEEAEGRLTRHMARPRERKRKYSMNMMGEGHRTRSRRRRRRKRM